MNKGIDVKDIVAKIKLPDVFKTKTFDFLEERYGNVEWSVHGIYDRYSGWFDGKITKLIHTPFKKKAELLYQLLLDQKGKTPCDKIAHYVQKVVDKFSDLKLRHSNYLKHESNWALELCETAAELKCLDESLKTNQLLIVTELSTLLSFNFQAKNIYNNYLLKLSNSNHKQHLLNPFEHLPIVHALEIIPFRYKAELCSWYTEISFLVSIRDKNLKSGYKIRNCIIEHVVNPDDSYAFYPDGHFTLTTTEFRKIFSKKVSLSTLNLDKKQKKVLQYFLSFID